MWLTNPDCLKVAKEAWDGLDINGWAGIKIIKKMQAMKARLKVWNKEQFGDINQKIQELEQQLHQFDLIVEGRQLTMMRRKQGANEEENFGNGQDMLNLYGNKNPGSSGSNWGGGG